MERIEELEPLRFPEEDNEDEDGNDNEPEPEPEENLDPDAGKSEQLLIDEMTGQLSLDF